jgi:quercetin dioxygenase-like cupin family protein
MIIRGNEIQAENGRKPYSLGGLKVKVHHFVTRVTTPDNPFKPHKHEKPELWYVIDGKALVSLDGQDQVVQKEDLIVIEPWVEHGLRTQTRATWICLG